MEQVTGIEPASPPWEGGIITIILYLHPAYILYNDSFPFVKNKKRAKFALIIFILRRGRREFLPLSVPGIFSK